MTQNVMCNHMKGESALFPLPWIPSLVLGESKQTYLLKKWWINALSEDTPNASHTVNTFLKCTGRSPLQILSSLLSLPPSVCRVHSFTNSKQNGPSPWKTNSQINNAAFMNYADISLHSHLFRVWGSASHSQMKSVCGACACWSLLTGWQRYHPLENKGSYCLSW